MPEPIGYIIFRDAIVQVISEQAETPQAVYRSDRSQVSGYPAVFVTPTNEEADYNTTAPANNRELYIYNVTIIYPFVDGQDAADNAVGECADELLRIFRNRTVLGAVADWVTPVPSTWIYQTRGEGTVRVAQLKLRVVKYTQ